MTAPNPGPNPGRIRASDAEREQVVSVLREAMSEGRLTLDEGEERIAAAYAATYRDELPGFTADLPPAEPAQGGPRSHPRGAGRPGGEPGETSGDRPRSGRPGGGGHGFGRPGWPRRPRTAGPPIWLLALLALAAGAWALAGGPLWPVIALGIFGLVLFKRGACHAYREAPR